MAGNGGVSGVHYLYFDRHEFTVLLSALRVDSMLCFAQQERRGISQEDYDLGLFSLFKRGLVKRVDGTDGFSVESGCRRLFDVVKASRCMVTLECKDGRVPQYGLYWHEGKCTVVSPGQREQEYVRMASLKGSDAGIFIEESGILPANDEAGIGDERIGLLPMADEGFEALLLEKPDPDDARIYAFGQTMVRIMQMENRTGEALAAIYLLEQPLQNKCIRIRTERKAEVTPYDRKRMIAETMEMMEG